MKYLGMMIDNRLSWNDHVDYIIKKTSNTSLKMTRMVRSTWGLSSDNMHLLYTAAIEPIITYSASVWAEGANQKKNARKLLSCQRYFLIRLARAYRTCSGAALTTLTGIMPIDVRLGELRDIYLAKKDYCSNIVAEDRIAQIPLTMSSLAHPSERTRERCLTHPQSMSSDQFNIYTDGSKSENGVGSAFAAFFDEHLLTTKKFKLYKLCSVFQAELLAINEATEWLLDLEYKNISITINTDSLSSVAAIKNLSNLNILVNSIHNNCTALRVLNKVTLTFRWIKAHTGTAGNELADRLANEAAQPNRPLYFELLTRSALKNLANEHHSKRWANRYHTGKEAGTTKLFVKTPSRSISKNGKRIDVNFWSTQFLTGHGCFKEYLFRFNISIHPWCNCEGQPEQTSTHILQDCAAFSDLRHQLARELKQPNNFHEDLTCLTNRQNSEAFNTFCKTAITRLNEEINGFNIPPTDLLNVPT